MGLINIFNRLVVACFCIGAAVYSLYVGLELHAPKYANHIPPKLIDLFIGDDARLKVSEAINQGQLEIGKPLISRLARVAPFDPLLYEFKLVEAISDGDTDRAQEYAKQVLSYQPRSLAARLQLFNSAAQEADFAAVFGQYEDLVRLRSLNDALLTDSLIGVFRQHGDWSPLLEYVQAVPPKGDILARKLLSEPIPVLELGLVFQNFPKVQRHYFLRLMQEGFGDEAYESWKSFTGVSEAKTESLPFNGRFADRKESPPFNWSTLYNRAEFQPAGGLYVSYPGTGEPVVVEQIMAAPPGRYLLQTKARGRMPANGGRLEWLVTCHGNQSPLARSPVALIRQAEIETIETEVSIPDRACDYQTLQLLGRPGELPNTLRVEILSVVMTRSE